MENFFIPFSHLLRKQFEFSRMELEYKWHFKNSEREDGCTVGRENTPFPTTFQD